MAFKPPPTAKVVDDEKPAAYLVGHSDINEDEAAKRRGRKMLLIAVGVVVVLALIGAAVGAGVAVSKKNDGKSSAPALSAPASTTTTTAEYTVEELKYLPAPGTPEADELMKSGSVETKLAYQFAEDAKTITPEKVVEFIDYFDKLANLTGQGVDLDYFKDQAYFVALWFRSKGYKAALDLLRNYANGVKPNILELAQAIEQVVGVLKSKADFKEWMKWPADKDDALSEEKLSNIQKQDEIDNKRAQNLVSGSNKKVAAGEADNARAATAFNSKRALDPLQQYLNVLRPNGWVNNPNIMGWSWFKPVKVRVVFHVLMFKDGQYAAPYNAYAFGSNPGKHLIDVLNSAYKRARVTFVLDEWRNDPNKWKYLNMGTAQKYQQCANNAETCHCKLALRHNKDPKRYVNVYVSGTDLYDGLDSRDIGYSSIIPGALDSCQETLGWKYPSAQTRHLWFLWDQIDPQNGNNKNAYEDGGMTVIHEMGHYFGLLHTHQGDCSNQDNIKDTSANMATQDQQYYDRLISWCIANYRTSRSPTTLLTDMNSCNGDKYIDNLFNYMSYTHAACYKLFTQNQVQKMQNTIQFFHQRWTPKPAAKKKP